MNRQRVEVHFHAKGAQVNLRQATRADIAPMHAIRMAVRENALSDPRRITEADYLAALDESGRTWVVEVDDKLAAFATGYRSGSIWALFVHPQHEGHGYGASLLATAVDWLWALGHQRIWLTTAPGTRAERFYRAKGWKACGVDACGDIRFELERP
jgi:GNAT superfamily N-acetyltransferase